MDFFNKLYNFFKTLGWKLMVLKEFNEDLSIVLGGEAGQGIQTVENIFTRILKHSGYNVFSTKEYMSRIRGGTNTTEIRVSSKRISSYVDRIDILLPLDKKVISHLSDRISKDTIILGEKKIIQTGKKIENIEFSILAEDVGSKVYINTIAVGLLCGLFKINKEIIHKIIGNFFSKKSEKVVEKNIEAIDKGYNIGSNFDIIINIEKNDNISDELLLKGVESIGMGAIAGGCNFISSYPMSPSTGILVYLSDKSKDFDIVAEQAEDEIAAINMALGAWYAGAKAMVTTSGGGFALMCESISLAAMLESPIVIHLAQRPGPATGLPTRTEQADLELALYAGHGESPRIILAPGTLEEGFELSKEAFRLSDKFQVPVFIMTDQFFIDSFYNIEKFAISNIKDENHFIKTDRDYKRYKLTNSGISPRGIPNYGDGLVVLDSDEHDEDGHITEDLDLRVKMVDKRLNKHREIEKEIIKPKLIGREDYDTLVVSWGSNYGVVCEALDKLDRKDVSFLHFSQVYPLHSGSVDYFKKAKKVIIVENNATSQFSKLIKVYLNFDIKNKILKYNGLPFSVEEIYNKLKEEI